MRTHKRRFVRVVGFVLLGCVFFASGFIFTQTNVTRGATTTYLLANYDLDKMVERSDLIIGGEILSISDPFWDENNSSIIRREATVNVNEVFDSSDEVSDTIKILLTGGVIGNYVHDVEPSVDLNVGDDMILFLRKSSDGEHYVILNSTQGALCASPIAYSSNDVNEADIIYWKVTGIATVDNPSDYLGGAVGNFTLYKKGLLGNWSENNSDEIRIWCDHKGVISTN